MPPPERPGGQTHRLSTEQLGALALLRVSTYGQWMMEEWKSRRGERSPEAANTSLVLPAKCP
jgi:hypothetical protein